VDALEGVEHGRADEGARATLVGLDDAQAGQRALDADGDADRRIGQGAVQIEEQHLVVARRCRGDGHGWGSSSGGGRVVGGNVPSSIAVRRRAWRWRQRGDRPRHGGAGT
jgi:hypothetical protein